MPRSNKLSVNDPTSFLIFVNTARLHICPSVPAKQSVKGLVRNIYHTPTYSLKITLIKLCRGVFLVACLVQLVLFLLWRGIRFD